jgi:hypothetical protein
MNVRLSDASSPAGMFSSWSRLRPCTWRGAGPVALVPLVLVLGLATGHRVLARQLFLASAACQGAALTGLNIMANAISDPCNYNWCCYGPYDYNWDYVAPLYYNQSYSLYGLPSLGNSLEDSMVQPQLNLGIGTARYRLHDVRPNQADAPANLYNPPAPRNVPIPEPRNVPIPEPPVPRRFDVRQRVPRPAAAAASTAPALLPRNQVLTAEGEVRWPASAPSDHAFGRTRAAAEAAIRVAVKEFEANGRASVQCVAEAKSRLVAYGKPALEQAMVTSRPQAERLLTFFTSLEKALNSLAGG